MAQGQIGSLLRHIRRIIGAAAPADTTDGRLLEQFCRQGDEPAFAALVRRHGPLVMGVCRRLLHDPHDAEDAFQAVFLILARRAGSIRRPEALSSWLYGVAYRVAARARAQSSQRRTHESQGTAMLAADPIAPSPGSDPLSEATRRELRTVIDEELNHLPDRYRVPMILCYLEGKSNEEAARQLGWTKGTVSGQLARGRNLLRNRLARRGVALSSAVIPLALGQGAASAAVPPALVDATVRSAVLFVAGNAAGGPAAAVALAESTLKAMALAPLKVAAAVVALAVAAGTGGMAAYHSWPATMLPAAAVASPPPPSAGDSIPDLPIDPLRADKVPLVLRVRPHGDPRNVQGHRWQEVVLVQVLKNTTGHDPGKRVHIASALDRHGLPHGECTVYLDLFHQPHHDGHWKLLAGGFPEGISHVAPAPEHPGKAH
jgi:RNA polymerase sigma factor (sigma-70 family)